MARLSRIALIITMNVLMCVLAEETQLYSDQYDSNIDANSILNDMEQREAYYNCLMNTGPCTTPEQKFVAGVYSEAVQTKCKKCTEKQKENFDIVADWYMKNDPAKWELMLAKTVDDMKKKANQ